MKAQIETDQRADRPHMALGCAVMDTLGGATEEPDYPGRDIRRAREAAGLSQAELGRRSGLGARTVRRVEAGEGNRQGRTIGALRRALGLPVDGAPPDPIATLRTVPWVELVAEITRRLSEAERFTDRQRIQLGDLPPGIADKPGVLRGPDLNDKRAGSDN